MGSPASVLVPGTLPHSWNVAGKEARLPDILRWKHGMLAEAMSLSILLLLRGHWGYCRLQYSSALGQE